MFQYFEATAAEYPKALKHWPVPNWDSFKGKNENAKAICEIYSKLTINTPERRHWRRSIILIITFEQISHVVLVFFVDFEQVNGGWNIDWQMNTSENLGGSCLFKFNYKSSRLIYWIFLNSRYQNTNLVILLLVLNMYLPDGGKKNILIYVIYILIYIYIYIYSYIFLYILIYCDVYHNSQISDF